MFLISDFVSFEQYFCSLNKSWQSDKYIFLVALWLLEDCMDQLIPVSISMEFYVKY